MLISQQYCPRLLMTIHRYSRSLQFEENCASLHIGYRSSAVIEKNSIEHFSSQGTTILPILLTLPMQPVVLLLDGDFLCIWSGAAAWVVCLLSGKQIDSFPLAIYSPESPPLAIEDVATMTASRTLSNIITQRTNNAGNPLWSHLCYSPTTMETVQ